MIGLKAFAKYQALGNDFVIPLSSDRNDFWERNASAICDRHCGIGADGILLPSSRDGIFHMRVVNADGGIPEMCGNGLRCFARYLAEYRGETRESFPISTDSGLLSAEIVERGASWLVEVSMPDVTLGDKIVLSADQSPTGDVLEIFPVDVGNPHAVIYADDPADFIAKYGRLLSENETLFPRMSNIEAVAETETSHDAYDVIDMSVYERGVGITLACGTGAVATAAVCSGERKGIVCRMPGGEASVRRDEKGKFCLRGEVFKIFTGNLELFL